ncbi:MAG TPA: hypothetical protein PKL70_15765 [Saprospiraceae bacterium]|nr:hypothetical protein [Saprospiraceae bacterium]
MKYCFVLILFVIIQTSLFSQVDVNVKTGTFVSDLEKVLNSQLNNALKGFDYVTAKRLDYLSLILANLQIAITSDFDKSLDKIDNNIKSYLFQLERIINNLELDKITQDIDLAVSTSIAELCSGITGIVKCKDKNFKFTIKYIDNQILILQNAPTYYSVSIRGNAIQHASYGKLVIGKDSIIGEAYANGEGSRMEFRIPTNYINKYFKDDSLFTIPINIGVNVNLKNAKMISINSFLTLLPKFPVKYTLEEIVKSEKYEECKECTFTSIFQELTFRDKKFYALNHREWESQRIGFHEAHRVDVKQPPKFSDIVTKKF